VDGCSAPPHAQGLCHRHYRRQYRHGDPLGGGSDRDHVREALALRELAWRIAQLGVCRDLHDAEHFVAMLVVHWPP
jgi:hypothetical protein